MPRLSNACASTCALHPPPSISASARASAGCPSRSLSTLPTRCTCSSSLARPTCVPSCWASPLHPTAATPPHLLPRWRPAPTPWRCTASRLRSTRASRQTTRRRTPSGRPPPPLQPSPKRSRFARWLQSWRRRAPRCPLASRSSPTSLKRCALRQRAWGGVLLLAPSCTLQTAPPCTPLHPSRTPHTHTPLLHPLTPLTPLTPLDPLHPLYTPL